MVMYTVYKTCKVQIQIHGNGLKSLLIERDNLDFFFVESPTMNEPPRVSNAGTN